MILLPYILFLLVLMGAVLVASRADQRLVVCRAVIGQMAAVTGQNLPLATGLMLAGRSEPGAAGYILRTIARLLAKGLSLHEAVAHGYPGCPEHVRSVIRVCEQAGRVPSGLRMLERELVDRSQRRRTLLPLGFPYAFLILTFAAIVWTFALVFLVPKFSEIFQDFDARLPASTRWLIRASNFATQDSHAVLGLAVLLVVVFTAAYMRRRPRRPERPRLGSMLADGLRWCLPGLRRMQGAEGKATAAALMRLLLESGMSLERAATLAAQADVNIVVRRQLLGFARLLAAGVAAPEAARRSGLGEPLAAALRAAGYGHGVDAALGFVAEYYGSLVSRIWIVLRSASWPLLTIAVGVFVGLVVTALFLPLVALIEKTLVLV